MKFYYEHGKDSLGKVSVFVRGSTAKVEYYLPFNSNSAFLVFLF